jgi:hypothetical protein
VFKQPAMIAASAPIDRIDIAFISIFYFCNLPEPMNARSAYFAKD